MADGIEFQLELKIDQANAKIDQLLNQTSKKAGSAGQTAGQQFGSIFQSVVGTYLGAISFNGLISGIQKAVGSYGELVRSNTALSNVVNSVNTANKANNDILKSGTSTLEQRASALGYTADQLYKTESASKSAGNATAGLKADSDQLEASIKNQERAFEDSNKTLEQSIRTKQADKSNLESQTSAINDQIKALKAQTAEQIKQLRASKGGDVLDSQIRQLEIQKNSFEITRDEAKLVGNGVLQATAQASIDNLSLEISLRQNKLDAINFETDALRNQNDVQISALETQRIGLESQTKIITNEINKIRVELDDKKNAFDINIEPAKRKLEDLKTQISQVGASSGGGGGSVQVLDPKIVAEINKKTKDIQDGKKDKEIDLELLKSLTSGKDFKKSLYNKYAGIISSGTINKGVSNLVQGGLTDEKQITELLDRYINEQAQGKTAGVSSDAAIENLSSSFKTGNSMIGNQSGQAANYSQIDEKGIEEFNKLNGTVYTTRKQMTEADAAQARYLGTMKLTTAASSGLTNALVYQMTEQELANYNLEKGTNLTLEQVPALDLVKYGHVNLDESIKKGIVSNDIYESQNRRLSQNLGESLAPAYYEVLAAITPMIAELGKFVKENPELILQITGLVLGLTSLFTIFSFVTGVVTFLTPIVAFIATTFFGATGTVTLLSGAATILGGVFTALTGPVSLIILAIGLFIAGLIWAYNNVEWFRNGVNAVINFVKDAFLIGFGAIRETFQNNINTVVDIFQGLLKFVGGLGEVIGGLFTNNRDKVRKGFEKMFEGLGDIVKGIFKEIVSNIFTVLNTGIRQFNNLSKNIPNALQISELDVPKFAKGGYFTKPTMGIFGEAGDEAILNMNAIKYLGLNAQKVEALNSGQASSSISDSYNNTTNIQNFGGSGSGNGFFPQTFFGV